MSTLANLPTVNFTVATDLLYCAMAANQTVMLLGDPGIGKSALVKASSKKIGLPLHILVGATLDATDIGGLPVRRPDGTRVDRVPLACIYECSDAPGVLFLDEFTASSGPVQAAMLRLVLERVAGDVKLHPETIVVVAANDPEQTPGGFELTAPMMNRMSVVRFRPSEDEITSYLRGLGSDEEGASDYERALADEASLFAAVANVTPDLLQIDIPKDCVGGGKAWASPRAVEMMIRARATSVKLGMDPQGDAVFALMSGFVGQSAAVAYGAIVKMITELPSVDEIVADPKGCLVPTAKDKQVAALGLMPRIARANLWAAYIYATRLQREFALAAHKALVPLAKFQPALTDPLYKEGVAARAKLTAMIAAPSVGKGFAKAV